jgi:hypothetical protein
MQEKSFNILSKLTEVLALSSVVIIVPLTSSSNPPKVMSLTTLAVLLSLATTVFLKAVSDSLALQGNYLPSRWDIYY